MQVMYVDNNTNVELKTLVLHSHCRGLYLGRRESYQMREVAKYIDQFIIFLLRSRYNPNRLNQKHYIRRNLKTKQEQQNQQLRNKKALTEFNLETTNRNLN